MVRGDRVDWNDDFNSLSLLNSPLDSDLSSFLPLNKPAGADAKSPNREVFSVLYVFY